jgi:hypothetical protein
MKNPIAGFFGGDNDRIVVKKIGCGRSKLNFTYVSTI